MNDQNTNSSSPFLSFEILKSSLFRISTFVIGVSHPLVVCLAVTLIGGCGESVKHESSANTGSSDAESQSSTDSASNESALEAESVLRFDGVYVNEQSTPKKYIRFTDREFWIVDSKQPIEKVATYIGHSENRVPLRGNYHLTGDTIDLTSSYLNGRGVVDVDGIKLTNDESAGEDAIQFVFHPVELQVVDDQARHLAACYEQWRIVLEYSKKAPVPNQQEAFIDAMDGLANWLEMTPDDRQQLAKSATIAQTPIGRLRAHAQVFLTPAGRLPPLVLVQNYGKFRPIIERIILTQLKHKRDVDYFVDWLVQCTPPVLVVGVLQELFDKAPASDHSVEQLTRGLSKYGFLRSAPTWSTMIRHLESSQKPALRTLAKRLGTRTSKRSGSPTTKTAPRSTPRRNFDGSVRNPRSFATLEPHGAWELVLGDTDEEATARKRGSLKREGENYVMSSQKSQNPSYFRFRGQFSGNVLLTLAAESEPTQDRSVSMHLKVEALNGQKPMIHLISPRKDKRESVLELKIENGISTARRDGGRWSSTSKVGDAFEIVLMLRGEATVRIKSFEVTPINAVLRHNDTVALRDLATLKQSPTEELDDSSLANRVGNATLTVRAGGKEFGGTLISDDGLLITHSTALEKGAGFAEVVLYVGGKTHVLTATPLRLNQGHQLSLWRIKPPAVLPVAMLGRAHVEPSGQHRIVRPNKDGPAITTMTVNQRQLGAADNRSLAYGTPVFGQFGQLDGILGKSPTSDESRWIPLSQILDALVGWSDVTGGNQGITRTWTDNSGNFSVVAKLVEVSGDNIKLTRENGETIDVAINRLSDTDQKLVQLIEKKVDSNQ